jgi:site-specific DNA-cytosine methylase
VSSLNGKAKDFAACASDGHGQTGSTLKGIQAYIDAKHPAIVLLENVLGFDRGSNLEVLKTFLEMHFYRVTVLTLSPHEHAIPQQRHRLWVLAIDCTLCSQQAIDSVPGFVSSLKGEPLHIDNFLLLDTHPLIIADLQRVSSMKMDKAVKAKVKATKAKSDKWVSTSLALAASSSVLRAHSHFGSSRWEDATFQAAHPWYFTLTDREKDCSGSLKCPVSRKSG